MMIPRQGGEWICIEVNLGQGLDTLFLERKILEKRRTCSLMA